MADESDEWKFSVDDVGDDDADDADGSRDGPGDDDAATDGEGAGAESDGSGVTILGGDDDGPTVRVGGPKTAAEELSAEEDGEGVAGPIALSTDVESGMPNPEHALFVALGVFLMVYVVLSMVVRLDAVGVLGLAAVVALAAGGLYAFFRRF